MHPKGKYRDASPPPPSGSDKIPYKPGKRRSKTADEEEGPKTEEGTDTKFIRYTELEEGAMEYVKPNVEDALPPNNGWYGKPNGRA
jgi:hypothetical protein